MTEAAPRIAVLFPCYNEEAAIADCVHGFRAALPQATIYVYDNASTDRTRERAAEAGALVRTETLRGKGNVVRRMFADIEADIYVLADGDNTYDAASAPRLVETLLSRNLDMVVGARVAGADDDAYRRGHRLGNRLLSGFVAQLFGNRFTDMLSGYRVFSRRFVKSFPALTSGFEIETELTVHALSLNLPVAELPTPYGARAEGSVSKLSTWRDGLRILKTIVVLFKDERPFVFFGLGALILALLSIVIGSPIVLHFLETGLVPRLPSAILATSIMMLAFLSLVCGLILDTVTQGRREMKRLHYLSLSSVTARQQP